LAGGFDFSNLFLPLRPVPEGVVMTLAGVKQAGVPVFAYGSFLTILLNFIILLAFIVFLLVRQMNRLRKAPPPAPAVTPEDIVLLREIRDSLKK